MNVNAQAYCVNRARWSAQVSLVPPVLEPFASRLRSRSNAAIRSGAARMIVWT
jgi:hypothetical protein